ncbi:MAG: gamma-glutamyltransferase [Rhodospirillales bacterium]|nr:gamma-glutamyltransferase [Rhodospirillales bacterium]
MTSLLLLSLLALTGCDTINQIGSDFVEHGKALGQLDATENVAGFLGGLATDEPHAALAGRDVLQAGGNAVDAATAIYFNLAVTMPSTAGLGGGGVCIVHDAQTNETKVLDFLSKAPQNTAAPIRANAIAANLAGFHALHARYGRLPWAQLVAPAEGLARFGVKVSRAFSHDLKKIGDALLIEEGARRIFARPVAGGLLLEGDKWVQPDLANVLSSIRENGAAALYRMPGAEDFAAAVNASGGALSAGDLIGYKPVWRNPMEVPLGDISVHFVPPPAAGGAVTAQMLAMMLENQRYSNSPPDVRSHLQIEAAIRAYGDRSLWMQPDGESSVETFDLVSASRIAPLMSSYSPDTHVAAGTLNPAPVEVLEDPSATTFAVMDEDGAGIACALTMNGLFGNGLIAKGTGILMAAVPGGGGRGPISLGPMLAVDHFTNDFFFAGAASGGVTAPTALLSVALANAVNVEGLEGAMLAKRLHNSGNPDIVYYEQGYDEAAIEALIAKGHRVAATPSLGRVNAVGCIQGLPFDPNSCEAVTDPRGYGLALKVDN